VQLLADVCGIPVILPGLDDSGGGSSVVLGAAMLGRFAAEVTTELSSSGPKRTSGDFNESIGLEDQGVHAGQTRQERAPVPVLRTQLDVDQESKRFGAGARLWNIMVRSNHPCRLPTASTLHSHSQPPPIHPTIFPTTALYPYAPSLSQSSLCAVAGFH